MASPTDPTRDLLFGALALQTGLADPARAATVVAEWSATRACPLSQAFVEKGVLDTEQATLIESLAAQHVRTRGGDAAATLATLGVGNSTYATLAVVGQTDPVLEPTVARLRPPEMAANPAGRFRVLRFHARGGLGEVFVAEDLELHREVALKQIQRKHGDDASSRARFLVEAEITGNLEHPGIVPVYGLGTDPQGQPYYAMRFIRGETLKEAIDRHHQGRRVAASDGEDARPARGDSATPAPLGQNSDLELRKLLRRFMDVCDAIDFAHGRGVLHRDLKPMNVIVGEHGETLVVDWGLAKVLGRSETIPIGGTPTKSSAGGATETLPGRILGTPAYMSPEQASGDPARVGVRSDVYSLGATLYVILAGRPPFDRGDVDTVLAAVVEGRFPRPRTLDPALDPALEAICLKAMALDPAERYATARALADDLQRWEADAPISAWREPWTRRAGRWVRRHRTLVTASAAAFVVATAGTVALLGMKARDNARLQRANDQLRAARDALDAANSRERARFAVAVEAIRSFHTVLSENLPLQRPEFQGLRDKLLEGSRSFLDKLAAIPVGPDDRLSRRTLADAFFEVGAVTSAIGAKSDALAALEQARRLRDAPHPEDRHALAGCLINMGILLNETGRPAAALLAFERARAIELDLIATHPGPAATIYQDRLARCLNDIGLIHRANGRPDEALVAYHKALELYEELARTEPTQLEYRDAAAGSLSNIGVVSRDMGREDEARTAWNQARRRLEEVVRAQPGEPGPRARLAICLNNLGNLDHDSNRPDDAGKAWNEAQALLEALVREFPAVTSHRDRLAGCLLNLGSLHARTGRVESAKAVLERALALYQQLGDADPSNVAYREGLAMVANNLGTALAYEGRDAEALAMLERARSEREIQLREDPTSASRRDQLAQAQNTLGNLLARSGRLEQARAAYAQAREIRETLAREFPAVPAFRDGLARVLYNLGSLAAGRPAERESAIGLLQRASTLWEELPAGTSASVSQRLFLADCLHTLALRLVDAGRLTQAIDPALRAVEVVEPLARDEAAREIVAERFPGLLRTANRLIRLRIPAEASRAGDLARREIQARASLGPTAPESLYDLASAFARLAELGDVEGSGVSRDEAARAAEGGIAALRAAVREGLTARGRLLRDPDLNVLRARSGFADLLLDAAFPGDPFAP